MTKTTLRRRLLAGGLLVSLAVVALPGAGMAKSGDVIKTASCSGSSHVKLKVGLRDGRYEVEGEVDQNRNGKRWNWTFKNDGSQFASGSSLTHAPSGSFSISRHTDNGAGTDTIVFRAVNPASNEVCRISATV
jgi:hypothetical protein